MYEFVQAAKRAREREEDDTIRVPDEYTLRGEINRVAATLIGLMDR